MIELLKNEIEPIGHTLIYHICNIYVDEIRYYFKNKQNVYKSVYEPVKNSERYFK